MARHVPTQPFRGCVDESAVDPMRTTSAVMVRVGMTAGSAMCLTIEEGRLKEGADAVLLPCTACVNSSVVLSRVLERMARHSVVAHVYDFFTCLLYTSDAADE